MKHNLSKELQELVDFSQKMVETGANDDRFSPEVILTTVLLSKSEVMGYLNYFDIDNNNILKALSKQPYGKGMDIYRTHRWLMTNLYEMSHYRFKSEILTCLHFLYTVMSDLLKISIYELSNGGVTKTTLKEYMEILGKQEPPQNDELSSEELEFLFKEDSDNTTSFKHEPNNQLVEHCTLMTDPNFKIDKVIGRDKEVKQIINNLLRKKKRNTILIGESGVGKTTVVLKLAEMIRNGDVPDRLHNTPLYSLDMSSMTAGTRYRGDFEDRFKKLIAAFNAMEGRIIVYIDEIHMMMGAGDTSSGGGMNFPNLIKSTFGSNIIWVGSTTNEDYRKYITKDKSIVRRFPCVNIPEPTKDEVKTIVEGLLPMYELEHGVEYNEGVIDHIIHLSSRYITDVRMPDSVLDIVDLSGVMGSNSDGIVYKETVDTVVSERLKVPLKLITNQNIVDIETVMKKSIFNQDHVIEEVSNTMRKYKAGLNSDNKPIGSYLFVGSTGVGKTEVAKVLSHETGCNLIRLDMSEYMIESNVSKLLGTTAGFVGYEDGGLMVKEIKKNPHSVLLLDEIEKAHPSIMNVFLQIMDNGFFSASDGSLVDCRHLMLIFTSNCGVVESQKNGIGFGNIDKSGEIMVEVNRSFSPEFRNRLTDILIFNKLSSDTMRSITLKMLQTISVQLEPRGINVVYSESVIDHFSNLGFDDRMGARPLQKIIEKDVKRKIVDGILDGIIVNDTDITVDICDNGNVVIDNKILEEL